MKKFFSQFAFEQWKTKLLIMAGVMGPGIITAIADNDVGGIATFTLIGSKFGYSMMFVLTLITITLAVTQEMGARLAIVTKRGLADLIREQYGIRTSISVFILLAFANLATIVVNIAGVKAAIGLLGLPVLPLLIGFCCLVFIFVAMGNYQVNQRIFLGVSMLYIFYIVSAFLAKPDWQAASSALFLPQNVVFSSQYLLMVVALIGTTVTPWGQFFIQSFLSDKKLPLTHLIFEQVEVYFGALLTNFISFFVIVAVAATLYQSGIIVDSPESAAVAIAPIAGKSATLLFGLGLLGAGFMGACVVGLTTAYAFAEFFGFEGSLDAPFSRSKSFYQLFMGQIIIATIIVLLPYVDLFTVVLYAQSINALLLPLILYFVLRFCNDKELMQENLNSSVVNMISLVSVIAIILCCLVLLLQVILGF